MVVFVLNINYERKEAQHGIVVEAPVGLAAVAEESFDMIVLPGGEPGTTHLAAAALFAASVALRSIELAVCPLGHVGPFAITTHALWHLTNAGVLHLLLTAAINTLADRTF